MSQSSSRTNHQHKLIGSPEPISALNRIPILEYKKPYLEREALVEVRDYCPQVSLTPHVCPYLRKTVADMLNAAQAALPANHKFLVGTCLRTLTMQKSGWDKFYAKNRDEHPEWPLSTLRRTVNKYYAPYDQPAPPGHCTGGAVDVNLLGPDGEPLDVLGPTKGWEAAYTYSDKIGDAAKANRMILVEAMLGAGFSNCRDEYWHYSWGDSAWAVRTGTKTCPYGWTHPPITIDLMDAENATHLSTVKDTRDQDGRFVSANVDVSSIDRSNHDPFRIRINWAKGVPVKLFFGTIGNSLDRLYMSTNSESWDLLEWQNGNRSEIEITPQLDRVILSEVIPEVKAIDTK